MNHGTKSRTNNVTHVERQAFVWSILARLGGSLVRDVYSTECTLLQIDTANPNRVQRFIKLVRLDRFNGRANIHPLHNATKNRVLAIQPWSRHSL